MEWRTEGLPVALALALEEPHAVPRTRELTALRDAATRAADAGGLVVLSGEAGVGKTRLVAELAAEAVRGRSLVLYGRCESEPTTPYRPFAEALDEPVVRSAVAQLDPDTRSRLGRISPGLDGAASSGVEDSDNEVERVRTFDALVACLRALAVAHPVLVVLEDLHWAQPSTVALLKYATARIAQSGVGVIGTLRSPDPVAGQEARAVVSDLRRRIAVHEVALAGLRRDQIAALVSAWTGRHAPEGLIAELEVYTGGNPFYFRSTLRQLSAEDDLVHPDGTLRGHLRDPAGRLPVPDDARELAAALLDGLDASSAALLQIGAVLGAEFALDEAAAAADLDAARVVEALDVVTEAGLVRQRAGAPIRVTFSHALIQQALRTAMTPARRALVSLRAAEAIEAAGAPLLRSGELALASRRR